ncbi:peptidoglycan-binding protein LysM, partial [Burkholderia sp. SG-MS1]|nr:peptidoglycan-binding protein LysM [Paraburkholderia sp. SG-MS1]
MGILSFIKEAGEKLFGAASTPAQAAPAAPD